MFPFALDKEEPDPPALHHHSQRLDNGRFVAAQRFFKLRNYLHPPQTIARKTMGLSTVLQWRQQRLSAKLRRRMGHKLQQQHPPAPASFAVG
ncbi:hypothetical protein ST47_g17 [Ascochyta rabiei]|uniref:Uncharacterized protein n=1 Tax=Didymella rabiei TaxID=5454 RepID=A0A163MMC2_DIDRA|nr:hypothetical protein ST47_g17 [Ascochyta rabiei]